jgi:hypothetical protein
MKTYARFSHVSVLSALFIISVVLAGCQSSLSKTPVAYRNFPPDLQQVLDQRMTELKTKGGICVAGKVKFSDRKPIRWGQDVKVNFYNNIDDPLPVYKDGWFIMDDVLPSDYAGPGKKIILRAFGYEPIDAPVDIFQGEITYVKFVMRKTPTKKLASIQGTIFDENDTPLEGTHVRLDFPFASLGNNSEPEYIMKTDSSGKFEFTGLTAAKYSLTASSEGRAYDSGSVLLQPSQILTVNRKLYPTMVITLDYLYQPNGSRDFTGETVQKGTLRWIVGHEGANFSRGQIESYTPDDLRDLELRQNQNTLYFQIFYSNGRNGFYDAGPVEFDSVTQADGGNIYSHQRKECIAGHVYVVRTYEDPYAKLIVRNIDLAKNL